ncbi:hypothetical protein [Amycolatopsis azurea]|nr:hypothetical protein [Amycolatopsis azurea]
MTMPWTDDVNAYVGPLWEPVDLIALGRNLAEGFIPVWRSNPEGETQETIDMMNNTPKLVISNSLTESPWENATVAGGDLPVFPALDAHQQLRLVSSKTFECGITALHLEPKNS